MERYRYSDEELAFLEQSQIPFAVYQFVNKRVAAVAISDGFVKMLGLKDKEAAYDMMDNNMYNGTHPDDLAVIQDMAYRFATEGGVYDVIYRVMKDGEYRIIHAYGRHITKEDGTRLAFIWYSDMGPLEVSEEENSGYEGLIRIGLQRNLLERSIARKESHDYLTGLPSMTYFFELAEIGCNEIRNDNRIPAIMFMDFNGMKNFNRKYGLAEGDRFLMDFARLLEKHFPHENCSRFSADHFCVYTDFQTALEVSKTIVREIEDCGNENRMPIRIGIYNYNDPSIAISAACDRAKIACDSNKKNYDSRIYLFAPEMISQIEKRQYIIENIDRAINEGWIQVYYQAIIRTANGKVCAEEALSRWIDPEKGILSPGDFIPVLEEINSIYKLDLYVVDCILKKMKDQADNGLYVVPQSVNLSRSDFYTCDIVEEIRKRIDESGIPRDRLAIEITEGAIADDIDYMTEEICRLKELGFTVWMDDYGSGYSSPMILQKVPFDLIKIDMLFVSQIEESEKAKIIVTETVRMAMALGMDTISEGIENKAQADFLTTVGCTMLQGFYYSKPISLSEIIDRTKKKNHIDYENPAETGYYAELGKVSLYDLAVSRGDDKDGSLRNYFDTWPMAIVEVRDESFTVVRCSESFFKFFQRSFGVNIITKTVQLSDYIERGGTGSLKAIAQCAREGGRKLLNDTIPDGTKIQLYIRRVAVNPVTGISAVEVAILAISDSSY